MAFVPPFFPQEIVFRGFGLVLYRKQTTRKLTSTELSANTLLQLPQTLCQPLQLSSTIATTSTTVSTDDHHRRNTMCAWKHYSFKMTSLSLEFAQQDEMCALVTVGSISSFAFVCSGGWRFFCFLFFSIVVERESVLFFFFFLVPPKLDETKMSHSLIK